MNEQEQEGNELLTAEDAAAKLKVSERTLLKWAREGKIGSVRLSAKMIRFTEEQVTEFVRRMTHDMRPEKTARYSPSPPTPYPPLPSKPDRKKQPAKSWKELRAEMDSWDQTRK